MNIEMFLVGMIVILDNYPSGMTPPWIATSKYPPWQKLYREYRVAPVEVVS